MARIAANRGIVVLQDEDRAPVAIAEWIVHQYGYAPPYTVEALGYGEHYVPSRGVQVGWGYRVTIPTHLGPKRGGGGSAAPT